MSGIVRMCMELQVAKEGVSAERREKSNQTHLNEEDDEEEYTENNDETEDGPG